MTFQSQIFQTHAWQETLVLGDHLKEDEGNPSPENPASKRRKLGNTETDPTFLPLFLLESKDDSQDLALLKVLKSSPPLKG